MFRLAITILCLLLVGPVAAAPTDVLRTTADVRALSVEEMRKARRVELSGQIAAKFFPGGLFIVDPTGGYVLDGAHNPHPDIGDLVVVRGRTHINEDYLQATVLIESISITGHLPAPDPRPTDAERISSGLESFNLVSICGFVSEVIPDENHAQWNHMVVRDHGHPVYVSVPEAGATVLPFSDLIDAKVEVVGIGVPHYGAERMFIGPHLETWSKSCIRVLEPPPADPFESPLLGDIYHVSPLELSKMRRRRAIGTVVAAWGEHKILLKENTGRLLEVSYAAGQSKPAVGNRVEAVGFPGTDLFRINLSRALVRTRRDAAAEIPEPPKDVEPTDILQDNKGNRRLQQSFYGKAIRLRGIVRNLPLPNHANELMNLDCSGFLVPIDVSATPQTVNGLSIGCELAVSGVCIMETANWRSDNLFPVFGGFMLVVRRPDDIQVVSRPPWWTPGRLLAVICLLFAALIAFFVWNRVLNHLVERRGRELFKEQVARAGASLKVGERTRLAVELHDSLSQNLAGLACQINAAKYAVAVSPSETTKYLNTAERMLLSSRTELRRCLWDLRGDTLEISNMTDAVSKTVQPVVGEALLFVRFNVPRTRLMDSTAHSILCIVRELSANAVRHGHATEIRIAGELHGDQLAFSVRDNGSGFDVNHHPGLSEGHFGLTGIRERVDRIDGTFCIESNENGTKARVTLPVPHATEIGTDNT